jgi:uncharacterized protein YtpQ (UPF0354 family)
MDEPAFTAFVQQRLRPRFPTATVERTAPLTLQVRTADRGQFQVNLDNLYRDYQQDPATVDKIVEDHLSALLATIAKPEMSPGLRDRIVPVLRTPDFLEEIRRSEAESTAPGGQPRVVAEPFNERLVLMYVEDLPRGMRYVTDKDIAGEGLAPEQLRELAISNLRHILPPIEAGGSSCGVRFVTAGGDYESSLLLFDSMWTEGMFPARGDFVVAVPARGILLVTGSEEESGLIEIQETAAELARTEDHPLTGDLFVRHGSKWDLLPGQQQPTGADALPASPCSGQETP